MTPSRALRLALLLPLVLALQALPRVPTTLAASPNTWTTVHALSTARYDLGAVTSSTDNRLYAVDGHNSGGELSSVEAYTPSTNTWATLASGDPTARHGVGVTNPSGYVYAIDGYNGTTANTTANYYSPSSSSWGSATSQPGSGRGYAGVALDASGNIYVLGGTTSSTTWVNTNDEYSVSTNKWYCSTTVTGCTTTSTPPIAMPTARSSFGIVLDGGLIYTIGGQKGSSTYTNVVEAYNSSTRTWTCSTGDTATGCSSSTLAPMPTARATSAAVGSNNIIYAIGGTNGSNLAYVEAYNPTSNTWECSSGDSATGCSATPLNAMPTARSGLAVAAGSDGNIYAIGGTNGSALTTVEQYTPLTLPGAPGSVSAAGGDQSATVNWTAPSTGGTPITSYTVTCTPSCTGGSTGGTSLTISGLTNGTSYTFTVTANNFVGSASATSGAVTPSCSTSTSSLAVSGAAIGNFAVTLTGSDQQVYTSLGTYTASNNTCSGWNLQMQATKMTNSGGDSFPVGSMSMAPPTVSSCQSGCGAGTHANPPSVCIHTSSVALDASTAVTVASAPLNTGYGSYTFTPGAIGTGNLQLSVPSYVYATPYTSTLTVTIVQGPAGTC